MRETDGKTIEMDNLGKDGITNISSASSPDMLEGNVGLYGIMRDRETTALPEVVDIPATADTANPTVQDPVTQNALV